MGKEIKSNLDATYERIKQRIQPAMLPLVRKYEQGLMIHSGAYALHYEPKQELYSIFKYTLDDPIDTRYNWKNLDKSFVPINSYNQEKIVDEFVKLVETDFYRLLSILLYEDEKCKCYFSRFLHFNVKIGNRTLSFILHKNSSIGYAFCKDNRFTYSEDGMCIPKILDDRKKWEDFSKELTKKLTKHFLDVALQMELPYCPVFKIEFTDDDTTYMNSKIGGSFFWTDNNPPKLNFLAQINFSELPKNDIFPKTGMLQFFIGNDEAYGLFDGKNGYRVVYHKNIENGNEIKSVENNDIITPIYKPCGMKFVLGEEFMTLYDFRFENYFSDFDDDVHDLLFDSFSGQGSKLMGYPFFTQDDPRTFSEENEKYNTLLLQLDSDGEHIDWGDGGVCNFFINDEAFENADVSDVLYNWDCY